MYSILIVLTSLACIGLPIVAYRRSGDIFHPAIFLGPMLAFTYAIMPWMLSSQHVLGVFLPLDHLPAVQAIYLVGIIAVLAGTLTGGRGGRWKRNAIKLWRYDSRVRTGARKAGIVLGLVGGFAFVYTVVKVGGLENAYGGPHSQGWASSGYIREARFFIVPGLALFWISCIGKKLRARDIFWLVVIALPLVFHSLASASRGPTFLSIVGIVGGWYIIRGRRPRVVTFIIGSFLGALLILGLVTSRDTIHYGGELQFSGFNAIEGFVTRQTTGNEYILGSGVIINALQTNDYEWGASYVLGIVIRVIPRSIWPTQYTDTAAYLGVSAQNDTAYLDYLGWRGTRGSFMSLIPELWLQFWVFSLPILFVIGYFYGYVWRRSLSDGGFYIVLFILLLSLSIFLTQQSFESMLFRLLFLGYGAYFAWKFYVAGAWRRRQRRVKRYMVGHNHKRSYSRLGVG